MMKERDAWDYLSRFEYYPRDTSADVLLEVARTSYDLCRLRDIAIHPNTPLEALLLLVTDNLPARCPYKRPDYDELSVWSVMGDLLENLGRRPGIQKELAEAIWESEKGSTSSHGALRHGLIAMIRNLDTPEDILIKIMDVSDRYMMEEFDERYEHEQEAKRSAK